MQVIGLTHRPTGFNDRGHRQRQSASSNPPANRRGIISLGDVFTQSGSKPEKLNESKCFPLFTQQRTSPRYFGMSLSCQKRKSKSFERPMRRPPDWEVWCYTTL